MGQEFATDCDGKFLTVSFLIDVQLFPDGAIPPLAAGDVLSCTVMDDQNQPIASVDKSLTVAWGLEWVEFDFGFLDLGLAAGTKACLSQIFVKTGFHLDWQGLSGVDC